MHASTRRFTSPLWNSSPQRNREGSVRETFLVTNTDRHGKVKFTRDGMSRRGWHMYARGGGGFQVPSAVRARSTILSRDIPGISRIVWEKRNEKQSPKAYIPSGLALQCSQYIVLYLMWKSPEDFEEFNDDWKMEKGGFVVWRMMDEKKLENVFNLQSLDMPTAKHFLNLQYWQRFLFNLITRHLPSLRHLYSICFWMLLLKNPWNRQWETNVIIYF